MRNYNLNSYSELEQFKSEYLSEMTIVFFHRQEVGLTREINDKLIDSIFEHFRANTSLRVKQSRYTTLFLLPQLVVEVTNFGSSAFAKGLIECYGRKTDIESFKIFLQTQNIARPPKTVRWAYLKKGDILYKSVETNFNSDLKQSHYPYIPDINDYLESFKNDSANILILLGEPGTGKTHFINELCHKYETSPVVSFDPEVMGNENLYVDFMTDFDSEIMILEDADLLLTSRLGTANQIMSKILNSSDGLIKSKRKFIFTANINNASDIDEALIRPGRCFDVLRFRPLTRSEAEVVATEQELSLPQGENLTLAEIYASKTNGDLTKSFAKLGFQ